MRGQVRPDNRTNVSSYADHSTTIQIIWACVFQSSSSVYQQKRPDRHLLQIVPSHPIFIFCVVDGMDAEEGTLIARLFADPTYRVCYDLTSHALVQGKSSWDSPSFRYICTCTAVPHVLIA